MRATVLIASLLVVQCASVPQSDVRLPSVSEMTLDQKIGQLFVETATGQFLNQNSPQYQTLLRHVRTNQIGGIHWYNANVYETALLTKELQRASTIPMLVSADLEAGIGMRLQQTTFWPWNMAIGATGDPRYAELVGRYTALDAKLLGINQVYAPVADVNNNPDNPVINVRSYGEDPETVGRFVAAFVRGLQSEGVLATVKHFPGHGDTQVDSHRGLPVLNFSADRIDQVELVPFRAAFDAGAASVMTAHLAIPSLDPTPAAPLQNQDADDNPYKVSEGEVRDDSTLPASLSAAITNDLLRRKMGFKGLVVTDALDMGGVTRFFGPAEAAVRTIESGADQALKSMNTDEGIAGVKAALQSGRLSMATIDAAVGRILEAKKKVGFDVASPEEIFRSMDSPEARAVAQEIATRSITLVREQPGVLPLRRDGNMVVVVVNDLPETAPLWAFQSELTSRLPVPPTYFYVDSRTDADEFQPIFDSVNSSDVVLVLFTVRFNSGKGTIDLPDIGKQLVPQLVQTGKPLVGISLGTPYVLRSVPELQTYIAAWGNQPVMQIAAARALFGETPITGRLPVSIPGLAPLGHGLQKPATISVIAP